MSDFSGLLELPLQIQTSLGAGYLGYVTAYSGLMDRHKARDAVFISFWFGSLALLMFNIVADFPIAARVALAVAAALGAGGIWRICGRDLWYKLINAIRVHSDDGLQTCWQSIVQHRNLKVGQIAVYTKDGRILWMNTREPYFDGPKTGLELGSDGSVIMVVEEETQPDGTEIKKQDIVDKHWGTRLTYVPADSISRVNFRML